jgi:hypothetical protein
VGQVKRSVVRRFRFPPQEHKFSKDGTACDPATAKQWPICEVDDAAGTIDLKVGSTYTGPWPAALVEPGPPGTQEQQHRLRDLGNRVIRDGISGADAATALLLRRPPDRGDNPAGPLRAEGETASAAAIRLAVSLRDSYLPMQGPPGTGKTYTAAEQILELIARGRTVGITGPSHAVIHHLIDKVYEHAKRRGSEPPRIGQRADRDNPHRHEDAAMLTNDQIEQALRDNELDVAAGTTWLWARAGMAASVDTLFVEESGQLSLANVLAVAGAGRNVILLGDPQQLAQPSHATHPPGAGVSALEHILGDHATMPAHAGLLLDQTYRMHPDLCRFTSETFYDGKLHGIDGLGRQEIVGSRSGLRVGEVPHQGNTNASPEEAREVARLTAQLTGQPWHDKDGTERPVTASDILILTPYNAQIRAIQSALTASGQARFKVGTVDKFQGREAPVVIYSMATSSADQAPRHGIPLRPAPPERRDLTRPGSGYHRRQPRPDPRLLPHPPADDPGERPMPGLGDAGLSRIGRQPISRPFSRPGQTPATCPPQKPAAALPDPCCHGRPQPNRRSRPRHRPHRCYRCSCSSASCRRSRPLFLGHFPHQVTGSPPR